MLFKKLYPLILLIVLVGCADTHTLIRQNPAPITTISPKQSFYISLSRDGLYGDEPYPGSGLTLSQAILSSFASYARRVEVATTVESYDEARKRALDKQYEYLVYPTILHWENRATEWNGIPDRVKVKIEVVKAQDDSVFDSVIIEGTSGMWTFGGDNPQDLLPQPIEEFVTSLFAGKANGNPPR